ncbi:hypothetical protein Tsubulata_015653 [Turnera subulata]|uniref:Protein AATF n=1 Tax=Turnera subulata TaxID=218843 RepID=A0A9Q0J167_9ROSI|nr:hypothetical protein Tsubulata_015653 [Turnera subulata]
MAPSPKRTVSESDLEDFDDPELLMRDKDEYEDNSGGEEEEEDEDEYEDNSGGEEVEEDEEDYEEENDRHRDEEMEDLEKEYMNLRNQEQDILKNLKQHKDEDVLKGRAVKNQKALWDKTLEFRFLLQKAFAASNRLPQEPIRSSFCDSDGVSAAYTDLMSSSKKTLESLLELQQAILERNPSISASSNGASGQFVKKHSKDSMDVDVDVEDEDWLQVSTMHRRIAPFRDKSIDKWQRKTQVTTGAAAIKGKLHAFNQNISEQVATYMRDPSKMIKQMRLRGSTVGVFGTVPETMSSNAGEQGQDYSLNPLGHSYSLQNEFSVYGRNYLVVFFFFFLLSYQEPHPDSDPELLSDSEFYQQLLKELFETIDPASSESAFYALKKLQPKKRKVVDRRASKSRKIRYNVHEKIVNFMAPEPMRIPPMAPKLFEDLFGLKAQKAS